MSGSFRVLFLGSKGSGTSSSILSIMGRRCPAGSIRMSDYTSLVDGLPTVEFESAGMWVGAGDNLQVFTPAQPELCEAIDWEFLAGRFHGYCVLVDNRRPRPLDDLQDVLLRLGPYALNPGIVVGVTHCDVASTVPLSDYQEWLARENLRIPVFQIDPRRAEDVRAVLECILVCKAV